MEHDWACTKWSWKLTTDRLRPPNALKWGGNIGQDFKCVYTCHAENVKVKKNCQKCIAQKNYVPEKIFENHFQSTYLPKNWIFINENLSKPFQTSQYWMYSDVDPWHYYPNEIQLRSLDFHSEYSGILATTRKLYLQNLQTLINLDTTLRQVRIKFGLNHSNLGLIWSVT